MAMQYANCKSDVKQSSRQFVSSCVGAYVRMRSAYCSQANKVFDYGSQRRKTENFACPVRVDISRIDYSTLISRSTYVT